MRPQTLISTVVVLSLAMLTWADPIVTLSLSSPQDGRTVAPGATIAWAIQLRDSTGDNTGLALVAVDLVQDPNNPAFLDLPPGDVSSIDATMRHFSRPAGISNPGEGGATTGYIGVQRGTPGRRDLVQIGGGQNTFGVAGPAIGTDPNVVVGVGQGGAPQTILTGALQAPRTPGPYVLRLSGAKANGLNQVHAPPGFSTLQSAATQLDPGSIRFTVALLEAGDLNCDAVVDFGDINPFVLALSDPAGYHTQYPNCPIENGDVNGDGFVNFADINPFVALLSRP